MQMRVRRRKGESGCAEGVPALPGSPEGNAFSLLTFPAACTPASRGTHYLPVQTSVEPIQLPPR
jgi:hypothetical protein